MQKVCGYQCAIEYAQEAREKAAERLKRKAARVQREKLKTRSDWLREAQQAFNAWVRERDRGQPCISCGKYHSGQLHAGHYRTTKAAPELRFHPLNCHSQCSPCNNYLSGNIVEYRKILAKKIGKSSLQWLEGPHQPQKWTIEDIKEIKQFYKDNLKWLKSNGI